MLEGLLADRLAVDPGTVAALQILDLVTAAQYVDVCMTPGYRLILQHDAVGRPAPDAVRLVIKGDLPAQGAGTKDQFGHDRSAET